MEASNDSNGTEISNCSGQERKDTSTDILFCVFLSAQTIIGGVGWVGNIILCYAQSKTNSWPFYQRLLFFNVTCASLVTAAIHCCQGLAQLIKFALTNDGGLGESEWSDVAGDTAHVSLAFGIMILAFQNLFALYQCSKNLRSQSANPKNSSKKKVVTGALLLILVWALAFGSILVGLNPHPEAGEEDDMAHVSYGVHLSIQASVAVAIFVTKRVSQRLQTDFAARRSQQNLHARMHIKETIDLTAVITRVLILHVTTWVASFTAAFLVNQLTESESSEEIEGCENETDELNEINRMAAFTGIVDFLALCFEAVYPFVLSWKQPQIKRHVKNVMHCFRKKETVSPAVSLPKIDFGRSSSERVGGRAEVPTGGRLHHDAIDDHWQMIAKATVKKNHSQIAWTNI